jgi:ribose 5-phosphate isomerase B
MPSSTQTRNHATTHPPAPILLGCDHAGFELKEAIRKELLRRGHDVADFTPRRVSGDDYPVVGNEVARAIVKSGVPSGALGAGSRRESRANSRLTTHDSRLPLGILICGSGVGVAIAANRVKGIRAVEGFDATQVKLAREHNDANILTLGVWNTPAKKAIQLVEVFLATDASKEKRHRRRVEELG